MSTPVELQRAKEQQLAAARRELVQALLPMVREIAVRTPAGIPRSDYGWAARELTDAILSSGVLRDADEIRRADFAAIEARYRVEREKGRAELRAAIKALCEEAESEPRKRGVHFRGEAKVLAKALRALLADDGAAALREHDAKVLREAADLLDSRRSQKGIASRALDPGVAMAVATLRDLARDTAQQPHTHGGTDAPECTTCRGRGTTEGQQ